MINSRILIVALLAASAAADIFNPNALLLRYSFDSAPPTDESPLQRGQPWVYGTPSATSGKLAGGVRFNPNGAQTDLYYAGQWNITAPVTITSWFTLDSVGISNTNIYGKILSCKEAYNDANGIEVQYNNGRWTVVLPGTSQVSTAASYNAEEWHHIAVSVTETTATIYLDGVQATSQGYNPVLYANRGKDVTVGGSAKKTGFNQGGEWHGVLDELRVYNYALNQGEVTAVYQQADYSQAATTGASFVDASQTCPSSNSAAATPALVARADNLPKGSDGQTLAGYPRNRVTLHRTQNQRDYVETPWNGMSYDNTVITHNTTTLTITNTASYSVQITSITADDNGQYFTITYPGFPVTLTQGQTTVLTIAFTGNLNDKGAARSWLHINSNDAALNRLDVLITGLFMLKPEGGNEVPLATIVAAFGFGTDVTISWEEKIESFTTPALLDEIPTQFLQAADPSQPINVHQIAAFGGITNPAGSGHNFHITYENTNAQDCTMNLLNIWAQTIVPMCQGTADGTCNVQCTPGNKRFSLSMDGSWSSVVNTVTYSDATLHYIDDVAFRFYQARNSDGSIIPNTLLVGQDYSLLKGCCDGDGCANCDYQDNIWFITNVKPAENPSQDNTLVSLPFSYSFNTSISSNAVDKNGAGLPFINRWYTATDSRVASSYDSTLLALNTAQQTLTYTATTGSLFDQSLKNAFVTKFDPNGKAFAASATVKAGFDNAVYAGVALGSDQRNFFAVYAHNGQVYAATSSIVGTQNGVFPAFTSSVQTLGQAAIPSGAQTITLYIQADPATNKIFGSFSVDGGDLSYFAGTTIPGISQAFGTSPAGRFFGNGASAGPIAWSDAGNLPVSFTNFGVSQCAGSSAITTGTPSTSSTTSSSSSSSAASSSDAGSSSTQTGSSSTSSSVLPTESSSDNGSSSSPASTTQDNATNTNGNDGLSTNTNTDATGLATGTLTTGSASSIVPAFAAVVFAVVLAMN